MSSGQDHDSGSLSAREQAELSRLIQETLKKPPTIGIIGVSGVGKSSTINAMFRTQLPISHTVACTKEFRDVPMKLRIHQGPAVGHDVQLIVCDAPGLGEDRRMDPEYLRMYRERLPHCDIILWVMTARNRAIALDQLYLEQLAEFHERLVFGVGQVDLVEPMDWKEGMPIPSRQQEQHIRDIVRDREDRLGRFLGRRIEVTPYSSSRGYNLEALFTNLLKSCQGNRSWIYAGLKNFSYADFVPEVVMRAQPADARHGRVERGTGEQRIPHSNGQARAARDGRRDSGYGAGTDGRNQFSRQSEGQGLVLAARSFFNALFGAPNAAEEQRVRRMIGRDDVDTNPPTVEELERAQRRVREMKRQSGG
ncbi:MAG TPA: GTPase [Longimicrobium sp.]|nr:GTPase [Longimicrobium sp.]